MKGAVVSKDGYGIVLEVGGIGYRLSMSSKALASVPAAPAEAMVWTHMQVKDDGISLYGFSSPEERDLFTQLIGVSGIGPKMAVAALSTFTPAELSGVIAAGDVTALSSVPGVGKKTAQRIVLELKGVLESLPGAADAQAAASGVLSDASAALVGMGFTAQEATDALRGCAAEDASSAVRYALRNLGGNR